MTFRAACLRGAFGTLAALMVFLMATRPTSAVTVPLGMTTIPSTKLALGSTLNEILSATEQCSRWRLGKPCAPEEFADELSDGSETRVPEFYLDLSEVSLADYQRCVRAARCRAPAYELSSTNMVAPELPVVLVSQEDASNYCSFRGARLPTEAEFESAARGAVRRVYPWGMLFHRGLANSGTSAMEKTSDADGYHLLAPVQSFSLGRSPEGVLHLAGNVAEWTSTPFRAHGSSADSTAVAVKGGSFAESPVALRGAARREVYRHVRSPTIGFRCAKSPIERSERGKGTNQRKPPPNPSHHTH